MIPDPQMQELVGDYIVLEAGRLFHQVAAEGKAPLG